MDHLTGKEAGLIVVGGSPSHLEVPQLRLLPPELRKSAEHSDTVKSIAFPSLVEENATMAYCWSSLLQTGLQWLVEKVVVVLGSGDGSGGVVAKTEKAATLPTLFPRSSTLVELVWSQVQAAFLTPLLVLIEHWSEQGLTHPVSCNSCLFVPFSLASSYVCLKHPELASIRFVLLIHSFIRLLPLHVFCG